MALVLSASVWSYRISLNRPDALIANLNDENSCPQSEECPVKKQKDLLKDCSNAEGDGSPDESFCNRAGRIQACGGEDFCCPEAGGNWSTDLSECNVTTTTTSLAVSLPASPSPSASPAPSPSPAASASPNPSASPGASASPLASPQPSSGGGSPSPVPSQPDTGTPTGLTLILTLLLLTAGGLKFRSIMF